MTENQTANNQTAKNQTANIIEITRSNIDSEHICCAFSDRKCSEGYRMKKDWLKQQFDTGYRFYRLNERAKVFIEYGPAEHAWLPITADNFLNINCFWVSGKYKAHGLAKELLQKALDDATQQGKAGLVTVTGKKKLHFLSDGKWFQKQGFTVVDETSTGFQLLARSTQAPPEAAPSSATPPSATEPRKPRKPRFRPEAHHGTSPHTDGLTAYYSNRCPFAEYHVRTSLIETAQKRGIPLHIIKLDTREQAQTAPSPASIFSLFYQGQFLTNDLSACMDSRFDKIFGAAPNTPPSSRVQSP